MPLTDPNGPEVRAYVTSLPQEEQQALAAEQVLQIINERFLQTHAAQLRLSENMKALIFVSLADLTQTRDKS